MNDYIQQLDLGRTSMWCRHSSANTIGNGGMRVLVIENPLAYVAFNQSFDQCSSLANFDGEQMF